MTKIIEARVSELTAGRVPFVRATVVRAQVPTSAHPGDDAIVLQDGSIEGFVGGQCAETSVRTAALGALRDGESVLLRVMPDGEVAFPDSPGAQVVVNPCLSGGALEIFLEPKLPPPLLEIVGQTPVAAALLAICDVLGYASARSLPSALSSHAAAVVVASYGRDEEASLQAAIDAGVGYIALVASPRRGKGVLDGMGLSPDERARISTPAGLDLGARTAGEVAVSIMAEVIASVRSGAAPGALPEAAPVVPAQAVDPVCGMLVTVLADTPHLVLGGVEHWFCNPGCRDRFAANSGR